MKTQKKEQEKIKKISMVSIQYADRVTTEIWLEMPPINKKYLPSQLYLGFIDLYMN